MTFAPASPAQTFPAYGLFPADDFYITAGEAGGPENCATIPQARWFFQNEMVAVPRADCPVAGFDPRLRTMDDLRQWNARTSPGSAKDYPALVWVGAPGLLADVKFDARCEHLLTADGPLEFVLTPRLESNRAYYNADSAAFFSQRSFRVRGSMEQKLEQKRFVVRTLWPADFRLDPAAPLTPVDATPEAIRAFVRSEPLSEFSTQLVWQRTPRSARQRAGRAVLGILLNGAQGDDDEAHGGHCGLVTGRVGKSGEMHDWLVANYYTLDSESEKGIIASMLPLENYLADLNSGQAWYRPSWMLVATLRDERTAAHLSSALARVFNQFYRHQFVYQHASDNCAGISISTLRTLGWNVPALGATSWGKALVGLPVVAATTGCLSKGQGMFDYFTEDQTRLFPAVAFEQASADLLQLVRGKSTRTLTPYEELLRQDVVEILLVRIPQLPSSRVAGDYPVTRLDEYQCRLPNDPAEQQIIPVAPRPFPKQLRDPASPPRKLRRSDYAVATYAAALLTLGGWLAYSLWRRIDSRSERGRSRPRSGDE